MSRANGCAVGLVTSSCSGGTLVRSLDLIIIIFPETPLSYTDVCDIASHIGLHISDTTCYTLTVA